MIRAVTAATYVQLWWPCFDDDRIVYDEHTPAEDLPRWEADLAAYVDPAAGVVLSTWEEALRAIEEDPGADPAAVLRFGPQVDIKGIIAPSEDAARAVRYLTKYLTKNIAETYTGGDEVEPDPAYEAHIDRLQLRGALPALFPGVRQLAAVRDSAPRRRARPRVRLVHGERPIVSGVRGRLVYT